MPELQRLPVIIKGIEDWAVEFSYALPSMYVVAQSGVWYRVAGPLYSGHLPLLEAKHPKGSEIPWKIQKETSQETDNDNATALIDPYLEPSSFGCSDLYKPYFSDSMETFFVSAHVVFSVLDVIVNNPRACNLEIVSAEAAARSAGSVTKDLVLKHYKFLGEQILALEPPISHTGRPLSLSSCTFVNQLKKEGEKHERLASTADDKNKNKKQKSVPISSPPAIGNKKKAMLGIGGFFSGQAKMTAPTADVKIVVTPMPDHEYWRALAEQNLGSVPFPYPDHSTLSSPVPFGLPDRKHVGMFLQIWTILMNFQSHLKLPAFSPELLASALLMDKKMAPAAEKSLEISDLNINNCVDMLSRSFVSSEGFSFLSELHILLLTPIVMHKVTSQRAHVTNLPKYAVSVCPPDQIVDIAQEFEDSGFTLNSSPADYYSGLGTLPGAGLLLFDADSYGTGDITQAQVETLLRMGGDVWVEVLRLIVADKYSTDSGNAVCLPEYAVPMIECENILKWILSLPEAKHLVVDADHKKIKSDDEDGELLEEIDTLAKPETLQLVLEKLEKGLYFKRSSQIVKKEQGEADENTRISTTIKVGDNVDYFDLSLGMWCSASVVEVLPPMDVCGTANAVNSLRLRGVEWEVGPGGDFDVTLPINSDLLAPSGLYSVKASSKFSPPVIGEVPEPPVVTQLKKSVEYDMTFTQFLGGMEMMYADVNRIFSNYLDSMTDAHDQVALSTKAVQCLFKEVYQKRVLAPANLHLDKLTSVSRLNKFKKSCGVSSHIDSHESKNLPNSLASSVVGGISVVGQLTLAQWLKGGRSTVSDVSSGMPPILVNWADTINCLQCAEYVSIPFEMRLQCLHLICIELASRSEFYDLIVNSADTHSSAAVGTYKNMYNSKVRDRTSQAAPTAQKNGKVAPDPEPEKPKLDGSKGAGLSRRSSRNSGGGGDDFTAQQPLDVPEPVASAMVEQAVDVLPPCRPIYSRIYPIGQDRDDRLYWIFEDLSSELMSADGHALSAETDSKKVKCFSRLFCEELSPIDKSHGPTKILKDKKRMTYPHRVSPSSWYSFDSLADVNALIWWLSPWGLKESKLKKRIIEWRDSSLLRKTIEEIEAMVTEKSVEMRDSGAVDITQDSIEHDVETETRSAGIAEISTNGAIEGESSIDEDLKVSSNVIMKVHYSESERTTSELTSIAETLEEITHTPNGDVNVVVASTASETLAEPQMYEVLPVMASPTHPSGRARRSADKKYNEDFLTSDDMNKALTIGAIYKSLVEYDKKRKRKSGEDMASPPDKKKKKVSTKDDEGDHRVYAEFTMEAYVEAHLAEIEATMLQIAELHNYNMMNIKSINQSLCICLKLELGSKGQLGVGVKDMQGSIIVTGYYNDVDGISPGRVAGIRLGDRILYCHGRFVNDIRSFQNAIKDVAATGNRGFYVMVLRYPSPGVIKAIQRCADEKDIKASLKKQGNDDVITVPVIIENLPENEDGGGINGELGESMETGPNTSDFVTEEMALVTSANGIITNSVSPHVLAVYKMLVDYYRRGPCEQSHSAQYEGVFSNPLFPRHLVYPVQCIGTVLRMVLESAHPYVTSNHWRLKEAPYWCSQINASVAAIEVLVERRGRTEATGGNMVTVSAELAEEVAKLKSLVKSCVLGLIPALDEQKTAYHPYLSSPPSRLVRLMAVLASSCEKATSWQAISTCVSILYNSIAWSDIETATSGVERDRFMKQFDARRKFGYIPRTGDSVVYYSSGHIAALRDEAHRFGVPCMWTSKNYPNFAVEEEESLLPFGGQKDIVCVCTVGRVTCYPSGLGTATGGVGRAGKSKAKNFHKGDRKNSFPFAYIELTVKGNASNLDSVSSLSKLKYDASNICDMQTFNNAISKSVKKYQQFVSSQFALCDPKAASKMGESLKVWFDSYEESALLILMEALVPGVVKHVIPMGDIVATSCKTYQSVDTERLRSIYVSSLIIALTKTLNILCANPLFGAFLLLVDADLFPDYYSLIRKPITLRIIETNILQLKYTHVSHFYADVMLLRDNCVQYCSDRYPDMIESAEALLYSSVCICERLLSNQLSKFQSDSSSAMTTNFIDFPMIGDSFSIGVRLLGNCSEYIIPVNKYSGNGAGQGRGLYPVGGCFSMPYQVANTDDEDAAVSTESSIVSSRNIFILSSLFVNTFYFCRA